MKNKHFWLFGMIIWRSWSPVTLLRSRTTLWNKALLSCSSLTNSMRNSTVWPALFWFHLHQPWFCWPPHYSITYCAVWESCRWPSAAVWITPFKWRNLVSSHEPVGYTLRAALKLDLIWKKKIHRFWLWQDSSVKSVKILTYLRTPLDLHLPYRLNNIRSVEHFQITKKKSHYTGTNIFIFFI